MTFKGNVLWLFLGLSAGTSLASESIKVPYLAGNINVDAELNEPQWHQAKSIPINIVTYPWENKPSPIFTEAKIFENGEQLFVAFIAKDPEPEKILAFLRDRDKATTDDLVGIKLDTFNDHRLAYKFFSNALGVQNDGIENVITGSNDNLWDAIWSSHGRITEDGYIVEFAIPFNILNFENSNAVKTWSIELFRLYPRDSRLRISNIEIDRDNECWVCQMREIEGFERAKLGHNLTLTPSVVLSKNESRDVYVANEPWQGENDSDVGLNLRWGINSSNLLNATLNPDFSTVEVDAGQLSINNNFSLYYDEKRPFFLDNADYFKVNNDLIYTRNIADPDYGAKFTGREGNHSYGIFVTNDSKTNIQVPGNNSSDITTLDENSENMALKYRYDIHQDASVSLISTYRHANDYQNVVAGIDSKYRLTDSDTLTGQVISSDTRYPDNFSKEFTGELAQRTASEKIKGNLVNLQYQHESENWSIISEYKRTDKGFRADLGFVSEVDIEEFEFKSGYTWYAQQDDWWQEIEAHFSTERKYSTANELIGQENTYYASIDGPLLSYFEFTIDTFKKIGLRHNQDIIAIADNSTLFAGEQAELFAEVQPMKQLYINGSIRIGKEVDYSNNRLGDLVNYNAGVIWNLNQHAEIDISYHNSTLKAAGAEVYDEDLVNLKLSYQFNVQSYLKLNMVYTNAQRNLSNFPAYAMPDEYFYAQDKGLSTQLIYAYKLNPQSVFYVGYSDFSVSNDVIENFKKDQRTAFMKFSYAWMM